MCCCCCRPGSGNSRSATGYFTQNIPVTMSYTFTPTSIGNGIGINTL